jgi:fido (protein-threonine AMPylation protein)
METLPPLSDRQARIVEALRKAPSVGISALHAALGHDASLATLKRDVATLNAHGYLEASGGGRSVVYALTSRGTLYNPLDAHAYCAVEPDLRVGYTSYDFDLFRTFPVSVFTDDERTALDEATRSFVARSASLSATLHKKELERFVIELSWKSSRIEGNTYTLLDTERLIREGVEAPGHSRDEATMILNHKAAFDFVHTHASLFGGRLTLAALEQVHSLIVKDLNIGRGMRQQVVGIVGTKYRPLDNHYQIREALESLMSAMERASDAYSAAFLALVGISYIQPFEDGNKRTARLVANALLMARRVAPLSYRSVDEVAYREATLVFYETHSIMPLKELFAEQYLFAAKQYGIGTPA